MKTSIIDIVDDRKHQLRYQHCLGLMLGDLNKLGDHRIDAILNKYYCGIYIERAGIGVTLGFPSSIKEADLPENLRLNEVDKGNLDYFDEDVNFLD